MPGVVTAPSMSTTIVVFATAPDTNDGPGDPGTSATPRGSKGAALGSTAAPPVGRVAQIANPDVAQTTATIAAINQRGTASSPGVAGCEGPCPPSSSASIPRQSGLASTSHSRAGSAGRAMAGRN